MKAVLCLLAALLMTGVAAAEQRPMVVELFTSQSCSSCPPADALLGELARRKDVVALGFHVTYWDGPGWKDPFARQASTDRQIAYDRTLTGGQIYTPQMVVDGATDVVGSDRAAVLAALAAAKKVATVSVTFAPDHRSVALGVGSAPPGANVVLARFALSRTTHVAGGENASRTLMDTNAVEALTPLGNWTGAAIVFPIEPPHDGEGLAVLVQTPDGRVLGAAAIGA